MTDAMEDHYRGALLGLATGDAVGVTLEFSRPGTFTPITDMIGGGPFNLRPGEWTDDTAMALCLAESLLETGGFDTHDQMRRYLRWRDEGHLSATGHCFDIGGTVSQALDRYRRWQEPFAGLAEPGTAGNGSLMRLAPIPMRWRTDPRATARYADRSSRTTHAAPEAVDACRYFAVLVAGALSGVDKETLLSPDYPPLRILLAERPLAPKVAAIAAGDYRQKAPPEIRGSGYVIHTLEAALWALAGTDDFRTGLLQVVNLGEDADSTGAVYGQVAGALYGAEAIPPAWLARLARRDLLEATARGLLEQAE